MNAAVDAPVTVSAPTDASPNIDGRLVFNFASSRLSLIIIAKRLIRITSIDGSCSVLNAFQAGKPVGLESRWIGDNVEVSKQLMNSLALLNQAYFTCGCDIEIAPGETKEIAFSSAPKGTFQVPWEESVIGIHYEYPRAFRMLWTKAHFGLRVDQRYLERAGV